MLIAIDFALSLPANFSTLQLPPQNQTAIAMPANATQKMLGRWPEAPFHYRMAYGRDLWIISCWPQYPDPDSELLFHRNLEIIEAKLRISPHYQISKNYYDYSGLVLFDFTKVVNGPIYQDLVADVVQGVSELWDRYGTAIVHALLASGDTELATFAVIIGLREEDPVSETS